MTHTNYIYNAGIIYLCAPEQRNRCESALSKGKQTHFWSGLPADAGVICLEAEGVLVRNSADTLPILGA